ncbi:protein MAIN-LIKE 1-like [Trifolium pratense]|uniref:protein MAIN-LIKE 1-like n=4 Tax=Trifolium pratense TaxID=57577 RepID=UPI001E6908F1|nr:protein MAIN-LIKE 1-like [Trifolium pratense]
MEENVGRGRHGKPSNANASARRELAANRPAKRGRSKQQGPIPARGTHDAEAGGSRTRTRSRLGQAQNAAEDDDFDADQFLNQDAEYGEPEEPQPDEPQPDEPQIEEPQQPPRRRPQQRPRQPRRDAANEGYGGGPSDMSLLTQYGNHRAVPIWDAEPDDHEVLKRTLRCQASGKKVMDIVKPPRSERWFWDPIEASGLEPLTRVNFSVLDYGVIWAFVERWHPETSTFHLPLGELGITLDDVQCLLHLPIQGKFLNHTKMSRGEGADMVSSYLGVVREDIDKAFAETNGVHLKHTTLQTLYTTNQTSAERAIAENKPAHVVRLYRERSVRAFMLHLVCCTIFSNKSSYYADVVYLQYFQDLSCVHEWNWGAAALVHLQHYLDHGSAVSTTQMAGYMSFLQGWIIAHFPRLSVWVEAPRYTANMPLNSKVVPGQGHKDAAGYRSSLDNIQTYDCVFSPYDAHRQVRPLINACWFSGWLRCGKLKAKHLPERVLRQFQHVQGIPRNPSMSATPGMNLCEIDRVFTEELELRMIDEEMRGRPVTSPWDTEPGYMSWFYRVSHPVMRPVEAPESPPRPPNLEVLIEAAEARNDPNLMQVCRSVKVEVERAVRDGEAVEGTPIHGTLQRILNLLNPILAYRRIKRGKGTRYHTRG